jgi:hypothetical protein
MTVKNIKTKGVKNIKTKGQRMSCLYVHNVPANLKSYFKAFCAKQEKTMTQVVLEYMRECTRAARQVDRDKDFESEY